MIEFNGWITIYSDELDVTESDKKLITDVEKMVIHTKRNLAK